MTFCNTKTSEPTGLEPATSAVAVLMGNPNLAMEAFGAGTILEVGKLSLEYAKQRNELRKICRENPISYIADAKRILKVP